MLPRSFYQKHATELAKALLGCELVHVTSDGITSGLIVETEAYNQEDAASHSYKGKTERTKIMFESGGHVYVYFTYGMHYCFNVVSGEAGYGEAVLIRALEPVKGLDLMKQRRNRTDQLTNGPAKLVQALVITKADYGKELYNNDELFIKPSSGTNFKIGTGPRVGISQAKDIPWRFWVKDNPFVS